MGRKMKLCSRMLRFHVLFLGMSIFMFVLSISTIQLLWQKRQIQTPCRFHWTVLLAAGSTVDRWVCFSLDNRDLLAVAGGWGLISGVLSVSLLSPHWQYCCLSPLSFFLDWCWLGSGIMLSGSSRGRHACLITHVSILPLRVFLTLMILPLQIVLIRLREVSYIPSFLRISIIKFGFKFYQIFFMHLWQ